MIQIVEGKPYLFEVKQLILKYTKELNRDLTFQNLEDELADIGAKYTAPEGELLVAIDDNKAVLGMVAYHKHSTARCEMKRLYVNPTCRGMKLGDQLVQAIIDRVKQAGFTEMVLDTIAPLEAAISLYKKMGFIECEAYYDNPMDDVIYMKKIL